MIMDELAISPLSHLVHPNPSLQHGCKLGFLRGIIGVHAWKNDNCISAAVAVTDEGKIEFVACRSTKTGRIEIDFSLEDECKKKKQEGKIFCPGKAF